MEVVSELSKRAGGATDIEGRLRLVMMDQGKVVSIVDEEAVYTQMGFGMSAGLINLAVKNQYLAHGIDADAPLDLARVQQYIKDGKLPDGVAISSYIDCETVAVP